MIDEYTLLLIKQYWEKPKARAEIELKLRKYKEVSELLKSIPVQFDVDLAIGNQLDVLGRIVGVSRLAPGQLPKIFFGFLENEEAEGFSDMFNVVKEGAPFFNKYGAEYTTSELDDVQYRQLIKNKIANNNTSAFMASDEHISIQEAIMGAFKGKAYVVDEQNMTLTLYISRSFPIEEVRMLILLNLLPKPQGVQYRIIIQAEVGETFGFSNNLNSQGFADKFDLDRVGGFFARKTL